MPGEFDMAAAVDSIGADLGFGPSDGGAGNDLDLDSGKPALDSVAGDGAAGGDRGDGGDGTDTVDDGASAGTVGDESSAPDAGDTATAAPITPAPGPDALPKTWRPALAEKWATLDPEIKAEVQRREEAMFQGIEGYKADAAQGKIFKQVMAPYEAVLAQHNIDPAQQISGLMRAHHTLALGHPQEKVALFRQLAQDYNVDLDALTVALDPAQQPFTDPAVAALQKELQTVKSHLSAQQAAQAEAKRAELSTEIDRFAADKSNVYFDEVANDMAALLQSGAAATLKEAYEKAIWVNPAVRQKELTRQQTESAAKAAAEAKAKLDKARKATSANVSSSPRSASVTAPVGSMDDTLKEQLAAIRGRG